MKKAFTFLEIMIVLTVSAVLVSMGVHFLGKKEDMWRLRKDDDYWSMRTSHVLGMISRDLYHWHTGFREPIIYKDGVYIFLKKQKERLLVVSYFIGEDFLCRKEVDYEKPSEAMYLVNTGATNNTTYRVLSDCIGITISFYCYEHLEPIKPARGNRIDYAIIDLTLKRQRTTKTFTKVVYLNRFLL